jgi:hypothetical protein
VDRNKGFALMAARLPALALSTVNFRSPPRLAKRKTLSLRRLAPVNCQLSKVDNFTLCQLSKVDTIVLPNFDFLRVPAT